ncbi:MAG: hypothetical protein WBZ31_00915 [Thiobacillus sp.]
MKLKTTRAANRASSRAIRGRQCTAALFLLAGHGAAMASCGSAFCSTNTDWDAQTPWTENATQLDVRMEYINQDQLRAGRDKTTASGVVGEHDEIGTRNRNVIASLSHAVSSSVSLTLSVPVVSRDHSHIHNGEDGPELESWDFTRLGDVRALAYWRLDEAQSPHDTSYGLVGGIKLPTGSTDERNAAGEAAERSLQPGTGSTDLIVGGFASGRWAQAGWFAQVRGRHAVTERQDYEPGDAVNLDLGTSYPLGTVQALAQINMLWRGQDQGANAEPADSGGTFIYFSPGLLVPLGNGMQLYGLAQLPLLQDVRGTQLTADWAASLGLTVRF